LGKGRKLTCGNDNIRFRHGNPLAYDISQAFGILTYGVRYTHSVSKRLQVLLPDAEMDDIRRIARREHITVGEWARRALRAARSKQAAGDPQAKLKVLREAVKYSFPTADIDQMLQEIERGYLE